MNKKVLILIVILTVAAVTAAGCDMNDPLQEVDSDTETVPGGEDYNNLYPEEDSDLEKHIPNQVIVKPRDRDKLEEIKSEYGASVQRQIEEQDHYLLNIAGEESIAEAVNDLNRRDYVEFAQPNYVVETLANDWDFSALPRFYEGHQWALHAIDAPQAWQETTGSSDTVIAVLDTGVDYTHQEFGERVLVEEGTNTLEDYDEDDIMDYHGHGTHVAGIAAAGGPNEVEEAEMAGASWQSKVLPVKVLGDEGVGDQFSVDLGIEHARQFAENNPDKRVVINMSLGARGYAPARNSLIDAALAEDVVVVAAMGNDFKNVLATPASSPGVIAVGATDSQNEKAGFSTEGEWISVAAPGEDIISSYPMGNYGYAGGTSMAAPYVAGTAALVLAENPDLSPADVKYHLEETAEDLGSPGFNEKFGHGIINAASAVTTEPDESPRASVYFALTGDLAGEENVAIRLYKGEEYQQFTVAHADLARMHDLPAAEYRAVVVHENETVEEIEFELEEGETKELDI